MVERLSPEHGHGRRRITPTEEEIQTAAKEWAEQIVNRYIMKGEKFEFADPYPDWDDKSREDWERETMIIVRKKAEKIINDPYLPEKVKSRAREFLEEENKK
jgi:hypothetical protein